MFGVFAATILDLALHSWNSGRDFGVFHQAGARWLSGQELYRLADGHLAYKYAPGVAALFSPLSFLPRRAAWILFDFISAVALVRLFLWGARQVTPTAGLGSQLLMLVLMNPAYANLFAEGQCDAVLLAGMVQSEDWAERRPWLSGAVWATACLFKPPFVIFLPLAVLWHHWRRIQGWVTGLLGWLVIGAIPYGFAKGLGELAAWRSLLSASTPGLLCDAQNQSLFAIVCTYWPGASLDKKELFAVVIALGLVTGSVAAWAVLANRKAPLSSRSIGGSAALYFTALLSPVGWRTNLLAAVPLFQRLLSLARAGGAVRWIGSLGVLVLLLGAYADRLGLLSRGEMLARRIIGISSLIAALLTICTTIPARRAQRTDPGEAAG